MKILIATQCRSIVGGLETYLRAVIPALLERGHEVAMLYDYSARPGEATVDPVESHLPVWYCESLRRNPEEWRELRDWAPDVVYSQGVAALDIDAILQESYPTVLYAHGYWGTCATGRKCHASPKIQSCERTFGPACLLLHYPRRCGGLNPIVAWKMYQVERTRHSRLADYRAILVASNHMYSEFQRNGVCTDKLHLVRLPLTETTALAPAALKTPNGKLLFVGRLNPVKGVDLLIRAIPRAQSKLGRKLTLTVAGDGPQMRKLQQLADRTGVAVDFPGWVDNASKLDLMRDADLLVVPSLWPEPFGLVGIEAGSVGLPAAGFAVGGIPDWLIAGETGELAPADPPTMEGLADAMVRALSDKDHYDRLRSGALEFSRRFTLGHHIAKLEEILHRCAATSFSQKLSVV